jgi:hypothetical protein
MVDGPPLISFPVRQVDHAENRCAVTMTPFLRRTLTAALLLGTVAAAAYYEVRRSLPQYPYGWSHCCDKILMNALHQYAERHDGWFPKGEESAEASLSLLHRDDPESVDADLLRGKTVDESLVQARLAAGQLLTPNTCGWHYVPGLRKGDNRRLALFWDKVGLGHNGERLPEGGHWVCFVGMEIEYIPGTQWADFLSEQERLRSELRRMDVKAEPSDAAESR